MTRPMATYREHHVERMNRADDAAERLSGISTDWIVFGSVAVFVVAAWIGFHIGIDAAERALQQAPVETEFNQE